LNLKEVALDLLQAADKVSEIFRDDNKICVSFVHTETEQDSCPVSHSIQGKRKCCLASLEILDLLL
jgi:hypothetical protein